MARSPMKMPKGKAAMKKMDAILDKKLGDKDDGPRKMAKRKGK